VVVIAGPLLELLVDGPRRDHRDGGGRGRRLVDGIIMCWGGGLHRGLLKVVIGLIDALDPP
jgi:hypothetical protein